MSLFNRKIFCNSYSSAIMPTHLLEESLELEDYYLNRQLIAEEIARKTKVERIKRELADYAYHHNQKKIPSLYYSQKDRYRLTDKIGCASTLHKMPFRDMQNEHRRQIKKEDNNNTAISQSNQKAIDKLNSLNVVLSKKRSDDLRFNELEYQGILAKEYKQKTYEDFNKHLHDYTESLIDRNKSYLQQVLGFREGEMKKMFSVKLEDNSTNSNNSNSNIIILSDIHHKPNGRYNLGNSILKDNPILPKDISPSHDTIIQNGKYIVEN